MSSQESFIPDGVGYAAAIAIKERSVLTICESCMTVIGRNGHQMSETREVLIPLTTYGHIVRAQVKYWDDNVVPNSQKFFYAIISARSPVAGMNFKFLLLL